MTSNIYDINDVKIFDHNNIECIYKIRKCFIIFINLKHDK
jgi:hypothetical protein